MPAANRFNFTKQGLEALPTPPKRMFCYDLRTRGLALRIEPSGKKAFYLYRKANGKPVMHKLGDFADLTIDQARTKALEINMAIANNQEVKAAVRARHIEPTFGDLFTRYMEEHSKKHKRSWAQDEERFRNHLQGLSKVPLSKISKADVRQLHTKIGDGPGRYAANKVLFLLRAVFNQAIATDQWSGANPAIGIKPYREESRERRLSTSEMPGFLQAVYEEINFDVRDFVLVGLFTGARKTNVLEMRWDQIDWSEKTWRIPPTKNGTLQTIPLNGLALDVLHARQATKQGPWVFPGTGVTGHMKDPRKGWMRILARAGIEELHIHDLRRTLGSWMVDTGASIPVIGKALHHQSQETTAIYARLSLDPVRLAMDRAIEKMADSLPTATTGS
jgi:integrase